MEALWYFDLVSPFAYLALGEIEDLATRMPVIFKPVLFGAMLSHWGQLGPAEIAPKRVQTYRICVWTARERGLPFRFPPSHPFNPLMLLRVLTALDARPDAVRTLFDLIWREGRDPQAPETLGLARQRLGIEDLDALIERGDAKAKLRIATEDGDQGRRVRRPDPRLGKGTVLGNGCDAARASLSREPPPLRGRGDASGRSSADRRRAASPGACGGERVSFGLRRGLEAGAMPAHT